MEEEIASLKEAVKFIQGQVTLTAPTDGTEPEPATETDWELHNMACALSCLADRLERAKS